MQIPALFYKKSTVYMQLNKDEMLNVPSINSYEVQGHAVHCTNCKLVLQQFRK